jgi:fructose-1,6-bisphosphatase/inositol monophosphatase family enzyme
MGRTPVIICSNNRKQGMPCTPICAKMGLSMDQALKDFVVSSTKASNIMNVEVIQPLWSGYGELCRVTLSGTNFKTVIVKHITFPKNKSHPKGHNSELSHQRKIQSYRTEMNWYQNLNDQNLKDRNSVTAKLIAKIQSEDLYAIILEDLDSSAYCKTPSTLSWEQVKVVIAWLASFHAKFMNVAPDGLWEKGTYWHLATRPDELEVLKQEDPNLWDVAWFLDRRLANIQYRTIVHGDAKLANFLFNADMSKVSAVDFQYVGGGCGMKDLAYFIGSCLDEEQAQRKELQILDHYFDCLKSYLDNAIDIENEWRPLYRVAWADFHRFIKGWSPGHWKITNYSEKICESTQEDILLELVDSAKGACLEAGKIAMASFKSKDLLVKQKDGGSSLASQVVTEVDIRCQEAILNYLSPTIEKYELGFLGEETPEDQSRLHAEYFWCVDPLDGTLPYSQGKPGFSHSIALVGKNGETLIAAVYDPIEDKFYHAIKGRGCFINGQRFHIPGSMPESDLVTIFADESLKKIDDFDRLDQNCRIIFGEGAVKKIINVMKTPNSCYFKLPKNQKGGCALWDLAAASLILSESGGITTAYNDKPINYNNPEHLYLNSYGFFVCHDKTVREKIVTIMSKH